MVKYIFFDLGDTLIDMSISHKALYFGLKNVLPNKLITDELVLNWERESYTTFGSYFKKQDEFYTVKRLQVMSLKNVLLEYSVDLADRKLVDIVNAFWRYFIKNCRLYDDVLPTLSQLVQDGYEIGLITNGDKETVISILRIHNLIEMFKVNVISSSLKTYKPNVKLFKQAIKLAKCSPCEAVYIGDSMIDIYGAKQLGLITVLICRNKMKESMMKNETSFKINSLLELPNILKEISSTNDKKYSSLA